MQIVLMVLTGIISLLLAFLGVQWLLDPQTMAAQGGMELVATMGFSNARGDFAGMFLAGAGMGVLGLITRNGAWLQALALLMGAIAAGRLVSLGLDGVDPNVWVPLGVEIFSVVLLLITARKLS